MHQHFIYCRKSTEDDDHQTLSLESQRRELIRFAAERSLHVVDIFFEQKSARRPGRPVFTELLRRLSRGEADGILSWHPNRLARNAVDGGQSIHLLDMGKLRDLRFPTFSFENSPEGKFMLMILFGQSEYEVDTLSEHVKRGNRTKRELGWLPSMAPIGYLDIRSDPGAKIIGRDPDRFPRGSGTLETLSRWPIHWSRALADCAVSFWTSQPACEAPKSRRAKVSYWAAPTCHPAAS